MHMKQRNRWPQNREGGQTLVEFTLVILVLLLVMLAIVDFSRLFFAYATMANGVREGARYATVHPKDVAGIKAHASEMMVLIGGTATVEVYYPDYTIGGDPYCSHYCRVAVKAKTRLDMWMPILPKVDILAKSTMHIE